MLKKTGLTRFVHFVCLRRSHNCLTHSRSTWSWQVTCVCVYLSSCCPPAWLCVWRWACRRRPGRRCRRARAGWCHSRPVCRCCPGCQCSDGSRRAAGPDRPGQYCREEGESGRNTGLEQQRDMHARRGISCSLFAFPSAEWTHSTGMNLARARKLPRYPAAAWRRTAGWEGFCRIFHKWSRKASAKAWDIENAYCILVWEINSFHFCHNFANTNYQLTRRTVLYSHNQ